jgi:hypothetical protein
MNALKHGMRSKKQALLDEESIAFENRLRKWTALADPVDDVGEFLVHQYVSLSFQLERVQRAQIQRVESLIEESEEREFEEVHELGSRLFFDPVGPSPMYGNRPDVRSKCRTSWNGEAVNPHDPAMLVQKLESTAFGCLWLREHWNELRARLDSGEIWQAIDRFKAIRLLGRQPVDALADLRIAQVFVASDTLRTSDDSPFEDLRTDMGPTAHENYVMAVLERWRELEPLEQDRDVARQVLLDLVDSNVAELDSKLEAHMENADESAQRAFIRLSFDQSPEGERFRRFHMRCSNAFDRGLETYRKYQTAKETNRRAQRNDDRPSWSDDGRRLIPDAARRTSEMNTRHHDSDASFAAPDVKPATLDRSRDWITAPDAGASPDSEKSTNEANPVQDAIRMQEQDSVSVTADSLADSGLDNHNSQAEKAERIAEVSKSQSPIPVSVVSEPARLSHTEGSRFLALRRFDPADPARRCSAAPQGEPVPARSSEVDGSLALAYHPGPARSRFPAIRDEDPVPFL